jgi:hypothetical protein
MPINVASESHVTHILFVFLFVTFVPCSLVHCESTTLRSGYWRSIPGILQANRIEVSGEITHENVRHVSSHMLGTISE